MQGDQEAHHGHSRAVAMQLLSYPVLLITAARQEVAYAPWVTHMVSCCPADYTWRRFLHKACPLGFLFCMMQRSLVLHPPSSAAALVCGAWAEQVTFTQTSWDAAGRGGGPGGGAV